MNFLGDIIGIRSLTFDANKNVGASVLYATPMKKISRVKQTIELIYLFNKTIVPQDNT
jgi:hypothetical protein